MLRSSSWIDRQKSWVSRSMADRSGSSKSGKSVGSGASSSSRRVWSHWPAKLAESACARGSASMRRVWARSVSPRRRTPRAASWNSSSSGMLLQRKYDSRAARSKSADGLASRTCSSRKRNCGEASTAPSASRIAASGSSPSFSAEERDRQQSRQLVVGRGPAEGPVGEGAQDVVEMLLPRQFRIHGRRDRPERLVPSRAADRRRVPPECQRDGVRGRRHDPLSSLGEIGKPPRSPTRRRPAPSRPGSGGWRARRRCCRSRSRRHRPGNHRPGGGPARSGRGSCCCIRCG